MMMTQEKDHQEQSAEEIRQGKKARIEKEKQEGRNRNTNINKQCHVSIENQPGRTRLSLRRE